MTHGLNVDAVRIPDECTIVVLVVSPEPRWPVVCPTRCDCSSIKGVDLLPRLSNEREMRSLTHSRISDNPKRGLVTAAKTMNGSASRLLFAAWLSMLWRDGM